MTKSEIITPEQLKRDYNVNLGFLDDNDKELNLICEIVNYQIEIYTIESEKFGRNIEHSINLVIKPIEEDWMKQCVDFFGEDEEITLFEKGYESYPFHECQFIKKQNND